MSERSDTAHRINLNGAVVTVGPEETPDDLRDRLNVDHDEWLVFREAAEWFVVLDDDRIVDTVPEDAPCTWQPRRPW